MYITHANEDVENVQNRQLQERLEPKAAKVWVDVANFYSKIPLDGAQHQPRFFPPIDLITGAATERKAKEFAAVWRIVRLPWLHEVFVTRRPPEFATRRAWKAFATGTFSGAKLITGDEVSTAVICFSEFLGLKKPSMVPRESFSFLKGEVPGPIDEKVTVEMVRETVCELTDLNFFFDMFEVEYHRTYDPPMEIEERMRIATAPFSLISPKKIPRVQLADRAAWLVGVRDFIRPWNGEKPKGFDVELSGEPTAREVASLEAAVAHVYCSNVTYILRRRPVLPRYE